MYVYVFVASLSAIVDIHISIVDHHRDMSNRIKSGFISYMTSST